MSTRRIENNEIIQWIRDWAFNDNEYVDEQDWDMVITNAVTMPLMLGIVEEGKSKKWKWFLGCLYLFVGDFVRSKDFRGESIELEKFLRIGESSSVECLQRWARRSRELLATPELFNHELWCAHGYANQEKER